MGVGGWALLHRDEDAAAGEAIAADAQALQLVGLRKRVHEPPKPPKPLPPPEVQGEEELRVERLEI